MLITDLLVVLPEIILSFFGMISLMLGVFIYKDQDCASLVWFLVALISLVVTYIILSPSTTQTAFNGSFKYDFYGKFVKVLILVSTAVVLGLSTNYLRKTKLLRFEYPVLVIFALVGMLIMVSANNLMTLYIGVELQSLSLYVIAAFRRDSLKSTEAGLKYFILGALSSGILLYGSSLVYGYIGSTDFNTINRVLINEGMNLGILFGLIFIMVGMAFKVSAVPFHMWTPDVYEGSPTPVTAFFASAPKVAALALFARFLFDAFGSEIGSWQQILVVLSFLSMFLGAIAAIGQTNIKRLMAFSSISHMGFALMGLAAGTEGGLNALLIYIVIYVIMNIGVFTFILNMERDGVAVTDISALGMYSKAQPFRALCLALLILSLAGIPPLVGFIGKIYIFSAIIEAGLLWLAFAGGIASVIGAYYYLRIVYLLYFGENEYQLSGTMPRFHWSILVISSGAVVIGTLNLYGLESLLSSASQSLLD